MSKREKRGERSEERKGKREEKLVFVERRLKKSQPGGGRTNRRADVTGAMACLELSQFGFRYCVCNCIGCVR